MTKEKKNRLSRSVRNAFGWWERADGLYCKEDDENKQSILAIIDGQPMTDKKQGDGFTQTDLDNLADIIWWIKGYTAGAGENFEKCPFTEEHAESLRKARVALDLRREK